jgi:hypothetical protein
VSSNFVTAYASFAGSNNDTVTDNRTATSLNPPSCTFTYIAPELTGPTGLPQTITQGQTATVVVILTPAVGGAAYPTGTVTLTDALTSNTYTATLPGTTDTISIPLSGLSVGTHTFTATYSGDTNYVGTAGVYTTTSPYVITVNAGSLSATTTSLGLPVSTSTSSWHGHHRNGHRHRRQSHRLGAVCCQRGRPYRQLHLCHRGADLGHGFSQHQLAL